MSQHRVHLKIRELDVAFEQDTLEELIWHELFSSHSSENLFDKLVSDITEKVTEVMSVVKANPDARPNWASRLTVTITLPKKGEVGSHFWEQGVMV